MIAVICSLLLAAGCAQTATLALKFNPKDSTTYKVTTEVEDSIKYEGSLLDDPALKNKRNHNRTEITFIQQIQSTDDEGNAIVNITIGGLKCLTIYQNNPVLDFDSSREKDRNNPLNMLIGQSYTIKIAPTSQVVKVIDPAPIVSGRGPEPYNELVPGQSGTIGAGLLSDDAIKKRHTVQALPAAERNKLRTDDSWSCINTFSFRQMGSKSYEKIYTLKEVEGRWFMPRIAIVDMNSIPTSEMAEELHKEQAMGLFSNMFDNIETYTGWLRFDLTAGRVEKYHEELLTEWIIADPNPKDDEEPGAIRMRAVRSYSLEKVNW